MVTLMVWSSDRPRYSRLFFQNRARLMRTHPVCVLCLTAPATQVDHIVNRARGGSDELSNLRPVCFDCHKSKTQDESREGLALKSRKRLPRQHPGLRNG